MSNRISDISTVASSLSLTDLFELEQVAGPTSAKVTFAVLLAAIKGTAQALGDTNSAITNTKAAITVALTAARTYTLPAANSLAAGDHVDVTDAYGSLTATNTAIFQRAGSDTINGATTYTLGKGYGTVRFTSDGNTKWNVSAPQQWSSVLDQLGASTNISVDGNDLVLALDATPTAPGSSKVKLFAANVGVSMMPGWIGPSGQTGIAQNLLGNCHSITVTPLPGSSTTPSVTGFGAATLVGTGTTRTQASTNLFTAVIRYGIVSASSAGSASQYRSNFSFAWLGNAAGLGGFRAIFNFGNSDAAAVANARMFVGFCNPAGDLANGNPSALTNIIGVGADSGDANLQWMHNDNSGTATKVDLGSSFPANSLNTDWYQLQLFSAPNSGTVNYVLINKSSGASTSGSSSSDLPSSTTFMQFVLWRNNGSTALAVGLDIGVQHIETNY